MQDVIALDLDGENVGNGCLFEPWELAERQKVLASCRLDEEPEAVRRDVLHFSTTELVFPGFADFTAMLLDDLMQLFQLPLVHALEVRQCNRRFEPEFRFAIGR